MVHKAYDLWKYDLQAFAVIYQVCAKDPKFV